MSRDVTSSLVNAVRSAARPLTGAAIDYNPLLDRIGDAHFVLLGEASHGTREFYRERAHLTQRLLTEKGFTAVAVEADWPDAYRVNRYVRGVGTDTSGEAALAGFQRFPTWMWRNTEVLAFVEWLRAYNATVPDGQPKIGFYGLDLYSLYTSMVAVLRYLEKVDPAAAHRARARYGCFEHFGEDTQAYGYVASFDLSKSCEDEVVQQLQELQRQARVYSQRDGQVAADEFFYAEQNARLVKDAEAYYRTMFRGRVSSWNLRDQHMADTLDALMGHLQRQGEHPKVVVWAHNSHLGDARATELGESGEWNVGQLVRERHGTDTVLVGFSSYQGSVTVATEWDGPAECKRVRPALPESYEALFHAVGIPHFLLSFGPDENVVEALRPARLERAIGVIYRPETERLSHYFWARLPEQFDAVLHFDETQAVAPLERLAPRHTPEAPETYPSGH
jgi:erythromycin esterase-like protein